MDYTDVLTARELQDFASIHEDNKENLLRSEAVLADIEADIMSDTVSIPILDPWGYPTDKTRLVSMSKDIAEIRRASGASIHDPLEKRTSSKLEDPTTDPLLALGSRFQEEKQTFAEERSQLPPLSLPSKNTSATVPPAVPAAAPVPTRPSIALSEACGIPFLTDPPSLSLHTARLQLSGVVKFSTSMECHQWVLTDSFVVLITDTRVKDKIIDISLDDPNIQAELVFENQPPIRIYPPIPKVLSYDVGVLRHFLFVRVQSEPEE